MITCVHASPLCREPRLILHSLARRLGGGRHAVFAAKADGVYRPLPEALAARLDRWALACGAPWEWHPFHRLLGRDFRVGDLRRASREGPFRSDEILTLDPKLVWEYGRLQACPLNALGAPREARGAVARHLAAEVEDWCSVNDDPDGLAWTNAMEVAIRAVNLLLADAVLRGELARAVGGAGWEAWLWNHGRLIWKRLESYRVASNHYLADLLGLAYVGAVFPGAATARAWSRLAEREFEAALAAQTYGDGALYEASLPYHGLVTEMALLHLLLAGDRASAGLRARVAAMVQIVADTCEAGGAIPSVGDDDGGRVVGVDRVAGRGGRCGTLLALAETVTGRRFASRPQAGFPQAGWWARRDERWLILFEYGPVGMAGRGCHAHNDDLSFCLSLGGHRLLVDPGSYLYTPDPDARNRFRSTMAHNVLTVDGREQRPVPAARDRLFLLPGGRQRIRLLADTPDAVSVERTEHRSSRMTAWSRELRVTAGRVTVTDRVHVRGPVRLAWRFHFAPECRLQVRNGAVVAEAGGRLCRITCSRAPALELRRYEFAPEYGRKEWSTVLVATEEVREPVTAEWTISEGSAGPGESVDLAGPSCDTRDGLTVDHV